MHHTNLFSLSGLVLKWVRRRKKEQNLSLKNSLFHCCSFLCCFKALKPELFQLLFISLTFAFLGKSLHWHTALRQEKWRHFATCLCWAQLITPWIFSTPPKLHNCSPYEMKLILCNVLMSNFNQGCEETALRSGNVSASCSKQILWF